MAIPLTDKPMSSLATDIMTINQGLFTSTTDKWATPQILFDLLNEEFHFTCDVCATEADKKVDFYFSPEQDGLKQEWTGICYNNPPYGQKIKDWVKKSFEASQKGATVVCLLPARTDTRWFHDYCQYASEIRFIKGRLHFNESKNSAPFPSCIVIFKPKKQKTIIKFWDLSEERKNE